MWTVTSSGTRTFCGSRAALHNLPKEIAAMHNVSSPRNDDEGLESAIQAAGANVAPRVTPQDVEDAIESEHYFTAAEGMAGARGYDPADVKEPLRLLTFCVLVLHNGFTVTGESACASPENFRPEIGQRVARANAVQKIWPLLGFRLRDRIMGII